MTDPASVNVTVQITGLDRVEVMDALAGTPAGCTFAADVTQPALGSKRHLVTVQNLSVVNAVALLQHVNDGMAERAGERNPDPPP